MSSFSSQEGSVGFLEMFYPLLVHVRGKRVINDLLKFHNEKNSYKKSVGKTLI